MLLRYSVQTQSSYYYVFDVYNNNSDKDLIVSFSNNKLNIVLDVVNIISFLHKECMIGVVHTICSVENVTVFKSNHSYFETLLETSSRVGCAVQGS